MIFREGVPVIHSLKSIRKYCGGQPSFLHKFDVLRVSRYTSGEGRLMRVLKLRCEHCRTVVEVVTEFGR